MAIISLLSVLSQCLDRTSIKQLSVIVKAMLTISGRVTMLGLSRWSEKGGSYRTLQRFYRQSIPWETVYWLLFRHHLQDGESEQLLAGDESVVTKAGKKTYGLDRFFSSIFNRPVRGLAFFTLSLVSVHKRKAYPLAFEQVIKESEPMGVPAKKAKRPAKRDKGAKPVGKAGRPKGSKNKNKRTIEWTPELRRVERMVSALLKRVQPFCLIRYLLLAQRAPRHFGNNNVMQMVRQMLSLHLISKLRNDSALYFCYSGDQKPTGARKRYGPRIDYACIPAQYLVQSTEQAGICTEIFQATMLHKAFADPLNVVLLVKTNLATQQTAHVVLFSSDLTLAYDKLIDYYRLRFQIEFNFRDAKQFWGLEDFMNVKQTPVTNAVGLAFLMVLLSQSLLARLRTQVPDFSILDLKALFRARRYAQAAIQLLPVSPDPILIDNLLDAMPLLGAIHPGTAFYSNP